jgi:hypothetical protein
MDGARQDAQHAGPLVELTGDGVARPRAGRRGDYGVGSDLDLVAVVAQSARAFVERGCEWDLTSLPVPAEILVYTESEWTVLMATGGRMARALARETVWLYRAAEGPSPHEGNHSR